MSNTSPIVTKKSLGLAGLAAVAACAACCSLPLLAAAGLGGSLLSGLAGYIRPGADLVVAGLVGVGVLGAIAVRARSSNAGGCETSRSTDGACGCGPGRTDAVYATPTPAASEAIVCSADLRDKPTVQGQLDGYRAAFEHLVRTERFPGGVRWIFAKHSGLDAKLRELARNEHQCCRFFQFDLRQTDDGIVWETTARPEAAAVLHEFGRLPEQLRDQPRGHETEAIKERITGAGLVFAADSRPSK